MTELWDPAIKDDPYEFVKFAFPWGKENTPLHNKQGPRSWQRDELQAIAEHLRNQKIRMEMGIAPEVYQSATSSGRGVGKSSLFSWLTLWQESCHIGSTTIVTANTEPQLKTKTWAELGKWHTLAINSHWFEKQALSLKPMPWFQETLGKQLKIDSTYYYAAAQLWSEENPDAFAGAHNENGMMVVFDEASGIPEKIWDVTEGFFTEPVLYRFWFVFSNPRRPTGAFYNCFHKDKYRDHWKKRTLDSRTVEGTDHAKLQQIVDKHGEDSDVSKVEVKGQFPSQGEKQFISRELVDGAVERDLDLDRDAPLIMGVDPARFGDDKSVVRFRQGRNARVIAPVKFQGLDNMQLANNVATLIHRFNPDAVAIDAGNGTGVIDRLREMGFKVTEVWFGARSSSKEWANKRTELWALMRDWLGGGCIDNDDDLRNDLVGPEYHFAAKGDSMMLEPKEKMKARGIASPDDGDALAVTFAVNPARRGMHTARNSRRDRIAKDVDYKLFGG